MAFKVKEPEPKPGQDCKDFKPMFWDRGYCKLANKCANVGDDYIEYGRYGGYCAGIKWKSVLGPRPKVSFLPKPDSNLISRRDKS